MQSNLVSIIMNCHNGAQFLNDSLNSIINQTYKKWEVIFWDNKSSDKSEKILKKYKDKRIKYFKARKFTSLGEARSMAFSKCNGEYVAFLDTDDIWYPKKLENQIKCFKKDVGIVTCNTFFFNDKEKFPLYDQSIKTGYVFPNLLNNYNLSLETLIFKKKYAVKNKINFDKKLSYISDFDFFLRLSLYCKLKYVPKILSGWRVHSNSESWKNPNRFNEEKKIFIKKIEKKYPEIQKQYKNLWRDFKVETSLRYSVNLIILNKNQLARKEISKIFFLNYKAFCIYVVSYIPFANKLIKIILNKRKKIRPI